MTEQEWLACTDPARMLGALNSYHPLGPLFTWFGVRPSWVEPRKARLFAAACCRSFVPKLQDERACRAVEVAELYVEGLATRHELNATALAAKAAGGLPGRLAATACAADAVMASVLIVQDILREQPESGPRLARLIRDLFNPFRHVVVGPACRTTKVMGLADTIYREPAYERLPILAEALEQAGCTDANILSHCRGPGLHVRGCWVVDLLLSKDR